MPAQAIFPYVPAKRPRQHTPGCSTVRILSHWFGSWNIQLHRQCHTPETLAERYDTLADSWDATLDRFETADAYRLVLSRALPDALIVDEDATPRVLDCGTGTGAFLSAFADAAGGHPELHGVDVSTAMLGKARNALAARGYTARFRQADVNRLPYPDDHFDVVLAAHVIEHVTDPEAALHEMRRVMKPGGLLVVCVTRNSVMGRAIQLRWRTHAVTEDGARDWLERSGFKAIRPLRALSAGRFDAMSIACVASAPESGATSARPASREAVRHAA